MTTWISRLARRMNALRHRESLERDLDDEMRFHLAMEAEELARSRGLSLADAERQARIGFGGVDRFKEAQRDERGMRWVEESWRDLRQAANGLRRAPGFAATATLVLALGIGACTAIFSIVRTVLRDPRAEHVVMIFQQNSPTNRWTLSAVDFLAIREQQRSFTAVGALLRRDMGVSAGGDAERARVGLASAGFFRVLGVTPAHGRSLTADDERLGAAPAVVVSESFAVRRLGGSVSAVGRSITLDGIAYTVVGVLPPDAAELAGVHTELWPALQIAPPTRRGPNGMLVIGRLKDGVTTDMAARDLAGISERIFPLWSAGFQDRMARFTPVPLREVVLRDAPRMLAMFSAAVALVLLIAVANVASLALVRATSRWQEVTLRTVLGATRARLVRLLVTESTILAAAGGLAGLALGALGIRILKAIGPQLPRLAETRLDAGTVAFAIVVALLAGLVIGAYPVVVLFRRDPALGLRDGERTVGANRGTHALRAAFVTAEFALALPLLASAGLLLNSFLRLQHSEPGFDPHTLLSVRVALPAARYPGDSAVNGFWDRALPLVRQAPGIAEAALGTSLPPDDGGSSFNNFDLVDRPVPAGGAQPTSPWPSVSPAYFAALGVPILDGRIFSPIDSANAPPVAVVSRAWAQRYFPEGGVVGRRLVEGGCTSCPPTTVVGVVGNVKYEGLGGTGDAVYIPFTQGTRRDAVLFVRTVGAPLAALDGVRRALKSVDAALPLDDAASMDERLDDSVSQPRHWTTLLGGFAGVALSLAVVGIFGMLTHMVNARRREIGVRMALGAPAGAVVHMIVRRGMRPALVGAGLGLLAALGAARWLTAVLFDISATDPLTLIAVTLLLLGAALLACWLPARRAAAIDPVEAIRAT